MTPEMETVMTHAEIEDSLWWEEYAAVEEAWESDMLMQAGGWDGVENDLDM